MFKMKVVERSEGYILYNIRFYGTICRLCDIWYKFRFGFHVEEMM